MKVDDEARVVLEQEIARLNAKVAALEVEVQHFQTKPQSVQDGAVPASHGQRVERVTQEARVDSEARFRDAFERSSVGQSQAGPNGKLLKVNQAFADMLGLSIEELKEVNVADITHPDDVAETLESVRRLLANECATYRMDKRYRHRDGHIVYADVSIILLRDRVGAPRYFVTTIVDITERKRAEAALQESEALYRSLFENMMNGFAHCQMLFDQGRPVDFIYLNVNQAFETQTGLRNVAGRRASEVIPGIRELDPELFEIYGRVAVTGRPEVFEIYVQVLHMWFAISVYSPKREQFVAVFDVVTERKQAEEALRASESLVKGILENVQDAYIRADNNGRIIMVSPSAVSLYGYDSMHEMIGLSTVVLYETEEERRTFIEELQQRSQVIDRIGMARKKDGVLFWVSLNARFFRDKQGQVAGAECFVRDITERMRTDEALRKSEQWHRTILKTAMDGFWLADATGRLLEVNDAYCRMSGYSMEELLRKRIFDLEACESANATAAHMQNIIALGEDRFESRHRRKDGSSFDVEVSVQYQAAEGGRFVVFTRDITERKEALENIREKEFLLSESQRLGHVGSWFWDMKSPISWSDELYRLYGVTPDTFIPTVESFARIIHPDDRSAMQDWIAACAAEETPSELEFRVILPGGAVHYFRGRGQSVRGAGNDFAHMAGTVQDITAQREANIEREQLEEQLRTSQKMEAIGRLAGGVAHDFNNLLSVILMYTGFAMEDATDSVKSDITEVRKAADRGVALVKQLLAFGRKQVMRPVPLDLNNVVAGMQSMLRRVLGEDIELIQLLAPNLGFTLADPGQVEQVLMNLVVNARDAMPQGGKLTIETSNVQIDEQHAEPHITAKPGSYVQLAVTDTGHGMDEQTRDLVFEPFFTTKSNGTGLGLSTVFGVIKQSGGSIWVDSEVGAGASFSICLPREFSTGMVTSSVPPPTSRRGVGAETILVVEDDVALLNAAKRTLDAAGYKVLTAASGADALRSSAKHVDVVHLLVTDVVMPHMSGKALAEELLKARPALKVLYMSGYTDNIIDQHGVLPEGTQFIGKPFSAAELSRKVREVLDLA